MAGRRSALALLLRFLGIGELCALGAVVLPGRWLAAGHAWIGLGTFPQEPVAGYLARSASALFALHGAMLVFLSFDTEYYRRLITFLAVCALVYGPIMLGVDVAEGMPWWWTAAEGPFSIGAGMVVLALQRRFVAAGKSMP